MKIYKLVGFQTKPPLALTNAGQNLLSFQLWPDRALIHNGSRPRKVCPLAKNLCWIWFESHCPFADILLPGTYQNFRKMDTNTQNVDRGSGIPGIEEIEPVNRTICSIIIYYISINIHKKGGNGSGYETNPINKIRVPSFIFSHNMYEYKYVYVYIHTSNQTNTNIQNTV